MPVTHTKIPLACLKANPDFSKEEQLLIVKSMLLQINLPLFRAETLRLVIRHFGTIKLHGNRKKIGKMKYERRRSKKAWAKYKKEKKLFGSVK